MKYTILSVYILLVTLNCQSLLAQKTYTSTEIQEDIAFMEEQLIRFHPNLYLYSKYDEFNALTNELKSGVNDITTDIEAYRLLSSYSEIIRDGHTSITPSKDVFENFQIDTALLPLRIHWDGELMHSIMDYSEERIIPDGSQLISINGVNTEDIAANMLTSLQHDGDNTTYPRWILNNFFTAYFYFYYREVEEFNIVYKDVNGKSNAETIQALCKSDISNYRKQRYPEFSEHYQSEKKSGITLKLLDRESAILTIRSFDNGILLKSYRQRFRSSIRRHLKEVRKNETETLIVDLRGNQGGHLTNGHFLLKRIMPHPYVMVQCFTKVNKKCSHVANARNKPTYGPILGLKKPNKKRYDGKVYFLVDGGSFSCSGIVTHVIKNYSRGIIVGEETGGSAYSLVGSPNKKIVLPNTGINVSIPRLQFILQDLRGTEKSGTQPDVMIPVSTEDLLNNQDSALEYILEQIELNK